jgi:predicted CoA-binding protein
MDRLGIEDVWFQLGVIDEAAASGPGAGLDVVMNTCPPWKLQPWG